VKGGGSGALGNGGGRLTETSSNFRFTWWHQAVQGWEHDKLLGTGAGTFHVTNLLYRDSYLDYTTEPHSLPLQFLTETGVLGLALLLLAALALVRGTQRRQRHDPALALLLPAYLVHSLVDIDWDFVAVSAPAFLAAGALAGGLPVRRVSPFGSLVAVGAALLAFVVLLLPWLGERWAAQATAASPARAVTLADRARSVDPLLVEPLWALAIAAEVRGDLPTAYAYYLEATRKQPKNAETWLAAGQFAFEHGCMRAAYDNLEKFTELDNNAQPTRGGDAYSTALKIVDAGKAKC
jgi:tetratricopeptide (TPR) repeat protein